MQSAQPGFDTFLLHAANAANGINAPQVLNSGFYIDPRTGEEDASIASEARLGIADILYNEFRSTSDAQRKVELLNEMKEMQERRVGGPLQDLNTFESTTAIIYANMIRKMGPTIDFQDVLDRTFQSCITALTDTGLE